MNASPMNFTEDILKAPGTEMVCYCSQVTKAQVLSAMEAGNRTLDDIKTATGACTQARCRETSPRRR